MSETIDMVFSNCVEWLRDWVEANPPNLKDEWDLSQWMESEMTHATKAFLEYAFKTARARNDAIMILRSIYYEYFLFQQQIALRTLAPNPAAVQRLPALPQSNQKSAAWHAEARDILSGHEFGPICVGSPSEWNTVLAKKCAPPIHAPSDSLVESRTVYTTPEDGSLSAFKWGWRYEPVARQVFETEFAKGTVFDGLGRIRHPTLKGLGASPDGLIMDGPRSGILVELKCPITRELDGTIPIRYYCQMQLQAEVCDVEAVDYFEIQFGAVQQKDVTDDILKKGKMSWIGKVCVVAKTKDAAPETYEYKYSPVFPATKKGLKDCLKWSATNKPNVTLESSVWFIKDSFHKTVLRNRQWWLTVGLPSYNRFWKEVEEARGDGRFKTKPLFVDTESDEEKAEEAAEAAEAEEAEEAEEAPRELMIIDTDDEDTTANALENSKANAEEVLETDRTTDDTVTAEDEKTTSDVSNTNATDVEIS